MTPAQDFSKTFSEIPTEHEAEPEDLGLSLPEVKGNDILVIPANFNWAALSQKSVKRLTELVKSGRVIIVSDLLSPAVVS